MGKGWRLRQGLQSAVLQERKGVYRMACGMNGKDWQWMRRCVSMKSHQHKAVDGGRWKGVCR